ncbi:ribbon-helix-helix protein, CopG family [Streptomyces xiamenensis]|uniref:ribbon-helix-helix protein, CopG family n=1 Tax=Streptomyces xiamenensis TaxID=408015 RepID=UPI0035D6A8DC
MPALNVDFTEDELGDLQAIARERGMSLSALVREAAAADIERHRALKEGAAVFHTVFARHADEFAAAFPEDELPAGPQTRAAA